MLDSTERTRSFPSLWFPERKKKLEALIQQTTQASKSNLTSNSNGVNQAKSWLGGELDELRNEVKIKDGEIEKLRQKISNLETQVEIESLKAELARLKTLKSKKLKRKSK